MRFWAIDVASPLSLLALGCRTPACPAGRQAGRQGMAVVLQHRVGRDAKGEVAHPQGSNVPARWRSRPVAAAQKEEGRKYET